MENKKENKNLTQLDGAVIPEEIIESKIMFLRGKKVILDSELSFLYGVPNKRLNEQVKRNIKRFPEDFMFQLNKQEFKILKPQIATSSWGGARKLPFAFTEHGILMLSSVLNSNRAIQINIQIMRIFVRIRQILSSNQDIQKKIEKIDKKLSNHDSQLSMQAFLLDSMIKKVNNSGKKEKEKIILGFKDRPKNKK